MKEPEEFAQLICLLREWMYRHNIRDDGMRLIIQFPAWNEVFHARHAIKRDAEPWEWPVDFNDAKSMKLFGVDVEFTSVQPRHATQDRAYRTTVNSPTLTKNPYSPYNPYKP